MFPTNAGEASSALRLSAALLLMAALCAASPAPRYDTKAAASGRHLYQTHCATCHGANARGDGERAPTLLVAPPDLTRIAQRSGGTYPFDRVRRVIDGRGPVPGHGGAGMPAFGDAFLEPGEAYSEPKVKERIQQLVHYLASLQDMVVVEERKAALGH